MFKIKVHIIQFYPSSSNFLSLRSKYSSKHPITTLSEKYSSLTVLHGKREISTLRGNILRIYKP